MEQGHRTGLEKDRKLLRLLRRFVKARRLGFWFFGTSYSAMPRTVSLGGRRSSLLATADSALLCDIINVWLDDEYGLECLGCIPETILDVGANIGLFSLWAHGLFPSATIHAYEPNPEVASCARENMSSWGGELINAGLSKDSGRANLISEGDSCRGVQTQIAESGTIPIIAFRDAVKRLGGKVDLLKLDCEGAEWEILNAKDAFATVNYIRMEYHLTANHTLAELRESTSRLGFSVVHLHEKSGLGIAWLDRTKQI